MKQKKQYSPEHILRSTRRLGKLKLETFSLKAFPLVKSEVHIAMKIKALMKEMLQSWDIDTDELVRQLPKDEDNRAVQVES